MADDRASLAEARAIVAMWRGFAVQTSDVIHGRSYDWPCLSRLRLGVMTVPVLGTDDPNPCRALIVLAGDVAVSADPHAHYDQVHKLCREVLRRCEMAEVGIDLAMSLLPEVRAA